MWTTWILDRNRQARYGERGARTGRKGEAMTITLNPNQEEAIRAAIRNGQVASVDELIERALASLQAKHPAAQSPAEQGLGLFSSPDDAALMDEVVSMAYAERRRPSQRKPPL
jgi:Arc/MetJ-type ribon-helix-helix transcriptional regulator